MLIGDVGDDRSYIQKYHLNGINNEENQSNNKDFHFRTKR